MRQKESGRHPRSTGHRRRSLHAAAVLASRRTVAVKRMANSTQFTFAA
jgi:hypothetical protein